MKIRSDPVTVIASLKQNATGKIVYSGKVLLMCMLKSGNLLISLTKVLAEDEKLKLYR